MKNTDFDIICLSHLKWETTLFQRPQQIMTQLSQSHRIIYVASCKTKEFFLNIIKGNIRECWGKHNENLFYINIPFIPFTKYSKRLQKFSFFFSAKISEYLSKKFEFKNIYLWLYYPKYPEDLSSLKYQKLIYDCMDLFKGFKSSSEDIQIDENKLIKKADIVFTGGKTLQHAKEGINPKTYCFPSGVEYEHFQKATLEETRIPDELQKINKPILGYFGAVDERINFKLLNYICEQRPEWSIVLLGPVVGLNELPVNKPNFYYLGKKDYAELPNYLKGFDVCLMPFVINELTMHISPTKTPEYLAGGKPVVSTEIPDVIEDYSDIVKITSNRDDFIKMVEECLENKTEDFHLKIKNKAETKSWKYIADEMEKLIKDL